MVLNPLAVQTCVIRAPQSLSGVNAMNSQGNGISPLVTLSLLCEFFPHFPAPVPLCSLFAEQQHSIDLIILTRAQNNSEDPDPELCKFWSFFFFPWSCSSSCSVLRRSPHTLLSLSPHVQSYLQSSRKQMFGNGNVNSIRVAKC